MSQKAQSLKWIESHIADHALPTILHTYLSPSRDKNIPLEYPLFLRTCPTRPLHGLMSSFHVNSPEEYDFGLTCLLRQMNKFGEKKGIVAVQPFREAIANIVWAPGLMSLGPGHDGVTAGREPVITVNLPPPSFYKQAIADLKIPAAEIEMVVDSNLRVSVTQVRHAEGHFSIDQPPVNAIPGFLQKSPMKLTDCYIKEVRSLDDISELCKLPSHADVIVSHPNGSMLSHAAAWCRQQGYSYAVTDLVKHLAGMSDYDKEAWLHEPSRGWLVSGPPDLADVTAIDYYQGTYFKGFEYALEACSLQELISRWVTLQPYLSYSTGKMITREMSGLAGVFAGTLLRSVMVMSAEMAHRATTSHRNAVGGPACRLISQKAEQAGPLNLRPRQMSEVLDALCTLFSGPRNCIWPLSADNWQEWRKMIAWANDLLTAFEERNRTVVVSAVTRFLTCVAVLNWAFADTFGQNMLDLPSEKPKEWKKTAQIWTRCLMILIAMRQFHENCP